MAEEALPDAAAEQDAVVVERRPLWQRIAKWVGIVFAGLLLLVVLLVFGINTDLGKRFIVDKLAGITTASGLNVKVGRIDGSLYGRMVLRDVRVSDPRGVFASSPRITLDWRPFAYFNNHVDVRELTSPLIRFDRLPELKPTPPSDENAPLLPDLDIDVDRLAVDRIVIGEAVTGERRIARIAGQAHIADRRAQIVANAATLGAPGVAGGDRLALRLDAVPDDNKLDIDLKLRAPQDGLVGNLAGLDAPLALALDGRGSWKAWNGRLNATLGADSLADLRIAAQNGTFQVRGNTHPGVYLKGPVERLTAPQLAVALDMTLADRAADTRLRLRSSAFALSTRGVIDLGESRFDDFRAEALLLTPGAIAENLRGRSVRAAVALNGPFQTPTVDYKLRAGAIGFGETLVEQVAAEGRATVDADRILIPISASARRVTGVNAAAGGLLNNVRIDGDLAINGTQILSDNLRLRSDNIDATAIIVADTAEGRYTGALKGRVNNYRIDSIGIVDVETDADLYSAPGGGFGIRGHIAARTQRIFNEGARSFLGGNAYARVDLNYSPAGIIGFSNLRVNAPDFRVTNGSGRYDPAGPLLVNADAWSRQYGPLHARLSGSMTAPVVLLRAPRPGLGVGLVDLEARVRGSGGAYAVTAAGGTDYGPFNADVLVRTGDALSVDIRSGRFAGMDLGGSIRQTDAGPFAGRVTFAGSGVTGQARLSAAGQYQRADIAARANDARIPGAANLTIGRAIIDATATLYDQPELIGDAQIANFKMGDFAIAKARAKVNYRGGNGTAQLVANGSSGVPFELAANARLSPDQYLVALKGEGNGIGFRTVNPMRIRTSGGEYRLLPTRIDLDKGSLRIAGRYGDGMALQARLDELDLSIANAFMPGLGIGGSASGSLDFAQAAGTSFPKADMRLNIANFQRSSIAAVSTPVNIEFAGKLVPDGGDARALIKRGTTTIGRLVATLRPLPPGSGSWMTRLMAAPLSGGVRYNGPAAVPFSFAGLSDQQLSGPLAIAADFGGRVQSPQLGGIVRSSGLTYENETYGTRLTNMKLDGRFTNDRFELNSLTADAGDGTVTAQGRVGLSSAAGFPIDIRATLDNARLARSDALGATATGDIRVRNTPREGASITGEIRIPEARYEIIRQGAAEVPELSGVRRKGDKAPEEEAGGAGPPGLFDLDLRIRAEDQLYVSGMGLESEWEANMRVGGTSVNPRITGTMEVVRGTYSFAGKRFELTRGVISFEGAELTNPQINIQATTTAEGVTAIINVTGSAQNPQIAFTSTPALPQDEVLSRLLFGSSVTNLSATEALQLAAALNSLRGSGGGLNPLGKLRSATGIDRLRVLGGDDASGRGTALAAGKYLTDDIYVEIITDAKGFTATQLEISLTKALSILSHTSSAGGQGASIRYSKDY